MHTVKLTGRPLLKAGKEYGLEVESITILDQKTDEEMENDERASFWHSLTLEELAARQGVTPADDLEAIRGYPKTFSSLGRFFSVMEIRLWHWAETVKH